MGCWRHRRRIAARTCHAGSRRVAEGRKNQLVAEGRIEAQVGLGRILGCVEDILAVDSPAAGNPVAGIGCMDPTWLIV